MAVNTNWYPMWSKVGVGLGQVYTYSQAGSSSNPEYTGPPAKLLERVEGNYGSEWVMVQASTTVSQYNCVVIDNNGNANNLTSALVASNVYGYGFAQFTSTQANGSTTAGQGDYFWALLKANGGVGINVSPSAGRGVQLYISQSTPGCFTSSVTSDAIMNIALQASIGTSASNPGEAVVRGYILPALNMAVAGATV